MLRFAFVLTVVLAGFAYADDKKDDKKEDKKDEKKLTGAWVREAEGMSLEFAFKKDNALTITVSGGGNGIVAKCKYKVEKDGLVKGTVEDVEEKGDFPMKPPKGLEFTFKFTVDGKKAKIEDFKAEGAEGAKAVIEGEYEAKKD